MPQTAQATYPGPVEVTSCVLPDFGKHNALVLVHATGMSFSQRPKHLEEVLHTQDQTHSSLEGHTGHLKSILGLVFFFFLLGTRGSKDVEAGRGTQNIEYIHGKQTFGVFCPPYSPLFGRQNSFDI